MSNGEERDWGEGGVKEALPTCWTITITKYDHYVQITTHPPTLVILILILYYYTALIW